LWGKGEHFVARVEHHAFSSKLELNDVGFLPQYNEHFGKVFGGWVTRKPVGIFREIDLTPGALATISLDGVLRDWTNFVTARAVFQNYLELQLEVDFSPARQYDTRETFDGTRFEHPPRQGFNTQFWTDSRAVIVVAGGTHAYFGADGYSVGGRAEVALQLLPQLELSLTPEAGFDRAMRFYGCQAPGGLDCTIEDNERSYTFARLDSGFLSFTLRGSWTFSPSLTLTSYAQLFFDRGEWSRYRAIDTTGSRPRILQDALMPTVFAGDTDGDGVKDDDFQDASLNLNVVARWEFRPGSTVIGVFTRSERSDVTLLGTRPRFQLSGLTTGPTEDVFLLKLVLFIS
jgi:hypothetical protein